MTLTQFSEILVKHGLVQRAALEDPEGYDNYRTEGNIRRAWLELSAHATNRLASEMKAVRETIDRYHKIAP